MGSCWSTLNKTKFRTRPSMCICVGGDDNDDSDDDGEQCGMGGIDEATKDGDAIKRGVGKGSQDEEDLFMCQRGRG